MASSKPLAATAAFGEQRCHLPGTPWRHCLWNGLCTWVSHLTLILYTASHLPVFFHLSSPKRRKLSQKRVDYGDRWLNACVDGDYTEQEMKGVFCCWFHRPPLYIFWEKKNESEERENGLGMTVFSLRHGNMKNFTCTREVWKTSSPSWPELS